MMANGMRAVLYARYSTDRQRETSIDDQLRAARERAHREGWEIVAQHADEGISGSVPVALRPGGKSLLAAALASRFEVLIVEGLDRLSRELGEAEMMVKRLEHRGIRIIGTADGYDSQARGRKVMRIARGLVNELYLDDLREKTHRGLAGNFDRGMSAGGRSYGYRTEAAVHGRRLVVDPVEAEVVREIFALYADGHSPRSICHRLNDRGIPTARGGTWAVSAMIGSVEKGTGLLNNPLYIGRVIWNRRQWIKDPDTGARRYVDRPREEWQVREDDALRIIDQSVWDQVHRRARTGPARGSRTGKGQVHRTLFGGLLRCQACGGPLIAINAVRYGCNVHKDRGPSVCANGRTVDRELVDHRLLAEVREILMDEDVLPQLQAAVRRIVATARREADRDGEAARRRLLEIEAEIGRLVEAIVSIGASAALSARLRAIEVERDALQGKLADVPDDHGMVADVTARWRRMLLQFRDVVADVDRDRTRAILADIIGQVTVVHEGDGVFAEFEEPADRVLLAAGMSLGRVAGARNSSGRLKRLRIA